ncbi:MAG: hypothetical protein WBA93_33885 [Microcoleaceae cyanobacterium]
MKQLPISCEKLANYLLLEVGVVLLPIIDSRKFGVVEFSGEEGNVKLYLFKVL